MHRIYLSILILICTICLCLAQPAQRGRFRAQFTRRSPLSALSAYRKRVPFEFERDKTAARDYKLAAESFAVYVPRTYAPQRPAGLFVWINSRDDGGPCLDWPAVFERQNLIFIGANHSGNKREPNWQRVGLALDAVENMSRRYRIDRRRIYVAGVSGGANRAAIAALYFPDVFTGGLIMMSHPHFAPVRVGGITMPATFPPPPPRIMQQAKQTQRYVFIAGEKDTWALPARVKAVATGQYRQFRHPVSYLEIPAIGHDWPKGKWIEKGIVLLDQPLKKQPGKQGARK